MLDVVAPVVAPGGLLVYAVCTFDRVEGESVLAAFLETHPDFQLEAPAAAGGTVPWARLTSEEKFVRLWPDRDDADAFFAARLRRRG
jgi:16S rRNA C967 or C1407 C5-methylase (RsmB/RsmF family)